MRHKKSNKTPKRLGHSLDSTGGAIDAPQTSLSAGEGPHPPWRLRWMDELLQHFSQVGAKAGDVALLRRVSAKQLYLAGVMLYCASYLKVLAAVNSADRSTEVGRMLA